MSKKYDEYLKTHKENVFNAFQWLRDKLPEELFPSDLKGIVEYQCKYSHDKSKNDIEEYEAYDNYFYSGRSYQVVQDFDQAWLHHIHNNLHHWQYWVLINDDENLGEKLLEIPYNYIIEMICDWWSFSWVAGNLYEIFDWYEKQKEYIKINPDSLVKIEKILDFIKSELDKEKCPNPNGELGICYAFDRYGDRNGCAAINCKKLTRELYNSNGDPLPGLAEVIKND